VTVGPDWPARSSDRPLDSHESRPPLGDPKLGLAHGLGRRPETRVGCVLCFASRIQFMSVRIGTLYEPDL
jgi:hypothetical protein